MKHLNLLLAYSLLSFPLLFSSCINGQNNSIETDKTISEIFTNEEINGLKQMLNYTDSIVLSHTSNKDVADAYHNYLDMQDTKLQDDSCFIAIAEEEKYQFLKSLNKATFNAVFTMAGKATRAKYKDSILTEKDLENYVTLSLNCCGKYADYLKKLGESDEFFKSTHSALHATGGITSTAYWLPRNHEQFDFNIIKNRLFVSVYILSIEEQLDKKMERYLNQKDVLSSQ